MAILTNITVTFNHLNPGTTRYSSYDLLCTSAINKISIYLCIIRSECNKKTKSENHESRYELAG